MSTEKTKVFTGKPGLRDGLKVAGYEIISSETDHEKGEERVTVGYNVDPSPRKRARKSPPQEVVEVEGNAGQLEKFKLEGYRIEEIIQTGNGIKARLVRP